MAMIRFYAMKDNLAKWRKLVAALLDKPGTEPVFMHQLTPAIAVESYDVELSEAERALIQEKLWYAESGTGESATGRPWKWNDCMSFHEMPGKCRCGKPATLKVRVTGEQVCKLHKPDGFVATRLVKWKTVTG